MAWQLEEGENGGNLHYQIYWCAKSPVRMNTVKRVFECDSIHCEVAIMDEDVCVAYVTKEDTRVDGPWEIGRRHRGPGARNDIHCLRDAVAGGKRGRDIYDDDNLVGPAVKYAGGLRAMEVAYGVSAPERPDIYVRLCIGASNTGKTTCCRKYIASLGTPVYSRPKGTYWEGYKGEKTVLLEEFGDSFMDCSEWKRLCDKYVSFVRFALTALLTTYLYSYRQSLTLPVKYGSASCLASTVLINANLTPYHWWDSKVVAKHSRVSIERRLDEIHLHEALGRPAKVYVKSDCGKYSAWEEFVADNPRYELEMNK